MSTIEYRRAMKEGRRQYDQDLSNGVYPYLQVLEELTQNVEIVSEVPLGTVDIPLDQIVGTNGHGRSTAFARNFMPLLKENTEFASKWSTLAEAHMEEGIREPIKCYEFMNRFYVIEGNKRVSVLKFFGAIEFQGEVTRLIPRPDDSTESKLYQEFLQFYKIARINYLVLTREGSYEQLLEVLNRPTIKDWPTDFQKEFRSVYFRFASLFNQLGGYRLNMTAGDGLLEYLKVYDFDSFHQLEEAELKKRIESLSKSMTIASQKAPVALHLEAEEEAPKGLMERITGGISEVISSATGNKPKPLKVAFAYGKTPETSAWTYGHELGRMYLEEAMKGEIEITKVEDTLNKEMRPSDILKSLAEAGNEVIFTTTPELARATEKAAVLFPKVKFLNCSVNMAVGNIRTYYGRMYEAKFLGGLIAGSLTRTNRVAYVADYPISGMIASINAFARGIQLVNPDARIHLLWSTRQGVDIDRELMRLQVDMVSHQDLITPQARQRRFGLYQVTDGETKELAMPFWNWGRFYERIIRSIQSGSWEEVDELSSDQAINYWWGLASKVIDIVLSDALPEGTRQLVNFYKKAIIRRSYSPFDGEIHDQAGTLRSEEDGYITTPNILTMDWLLDNVEGSIPTMEELRFEARNLIKTTEEAGENSKGVTELKPL